MFKDIYKSLERKWEIKRKSDLKFISGCLKYNCRFAFKSVAAFAAIWLVVVYFTFSRS